MAEIKVLNEHEITIYPLPDKPTKQRVITYQAEGLAPRTLWLDSDKIPDAAWQLANPGKLVPKDLQTKGDLVRRAAIEADVAMIKQRSQVRSI
jgi:hypothetical protein